MGGIRGRIAVVIVLSSLALGQPAISAGPVPTYQVRESVEQLSVTGAVPGEQVVVERDGPGGPAVLQTPPLPATVAMLGTGSIDLFVRSDASDADLEVVLSEVRPNVDALAAPAAPAAAAPRFTG